MDSCAKEVFWSREETRRLITEFEKYPVLYDASHPDFSKISKKNEAARKIMHSLKSMKPDLDIIHVKNKIKGLRQQLSREKKFLESALSSSITYKPRLWCYEELSFMRATNATYRPNPKISKRIKDESSNCSGDSCTVDSLEESYNTEDMFFDDEDIEKEIFEENVKLTNNKSMRYSEDNNEQSTEKTRNDLTLNAFCQYLCLELKALKREDSFEKVKFEILKLLMDAKAEERGQLPENWQPLNS